MIKGNIQKILGKLGYEIHQKKPSYIKLNEKASYSQCGEDLIVSYIFALRNIPAPSYIDIGANDPFYISNTALFYKRGCKGINIEANPYLIDKFNTYRPLNINLNVGIGLSEGEQDFYVMNDPTLSSFAMTECENYIKTGKYHIVETIKVKTATLNSIIQQYCQGIFPDFMSLDVEGLDMEILKSIDYETSSPKVICVEAAEYSPIGAGERRTELVDFLVGKGYYEYANTNLNAIMVRKDFWFI
jgi:FkbM family methyltransferase